MYTKRVQLVNYGPIEKLDIQFPFEGEMPKPIVLVGENGSGKSILLSHIVSGLVTAKSIAYPETPEVELGKVYKLRSNTYIKPGSEYSFGRVDFDGGFFVSEIRLRQDKGVQGDLPSGISETDAEAAWNNVKPGENDHYLSNLTRGTDTTKTLKNIYSKNCVLYFPFNRFEEPAWLNEENLKARAQYMDIKHIVGYTSRRVLTYSPLRETQDWLFDLAYDRAAFELQTSPIKIPINDNSAGISLPVFTGYSGDAARAYEAALEIVRAVVKGADVRFGIGRRNNRVVTIESETGQLVPNIFQLSSGETSLLDLFLSILRDFDLCETPFADTAEIRGIVVVDEVDLHLHATHQHEILPKLIQMFPKVQFVLTTHSPLFVLGMSKLLGEDGFALYRMPQGERISPEEFNEFGEAYRSFSATRKFGNDIRTAIEQSQKPIVLLEGTTDQLYVEKAASVLGKEPVLQNLQLRYGGGGGNLVNIWKEWKAPLTDILPQKVVLLFDCDKQRSEQDKGQLLQRSIPFHADNPVKKGIENLFPELTLSKAYGYTPAFFDISSSHTNTVRGEEKQIAEQWTVNEAEKTNLCTWLCDNGTEEDFIAFQAIFELLEGILDSSSEPPGTAGIP